MVITPFYTTLWNWSANVVKAVGLNLDSNEIYQSCAFMTLTGVLSKILFMPFTIYSTFWVEQVHGFNKQVS